MSIHLHSVMVVVDDQDVALDFYCGVLGWTKTIDNMMGPNFRFITVHPPGHSTGINLGQPHIAGRPSPGSDTPADAGINLVSTDLLAEGQRRGLRTRSRTDAVGRPRCNFHGSIW